MYIILTNKRKSETQASSGVMGSSLTSLWTKNVKLLPGDVLVAVADNLKERASDIDVRRVYTWFTAITNIDILENDLLYELVDESETGRVFKVRGVSKWPTSVAVLIEEIEE